MSGFIFNSNQIPMMSVPKSVADRFLPIATGAQIKVILCLIRFEDMALTTQDIAKQCNIASDDAKAAIEFWTSSGLIVRRGSSLILSQIASAQAQTLPKYNPESILELKSSDNDFAYLLDEVQRILGKSLNHNDASVIFGMYDNLGFSTDLILQIINYCLNGGKSNFRYIEKVALDWYDRGIDSFDKAETLIKSLEKNARIERAVSTYFGIDNRALSKKEREFIENWTSTWGMSLEMIKEAYERCVDSKGKLSFAYINGILNDWVKKSVKTVGDIEKASPTKLNNEKSFDSSDIENEILKRLAGE